MDHITDTDRLVAAMPEIIEAQLLAYQKLLRQFKKKDEEIEKAYESGEEPSEKATAELQKLKKEYAWFKGFFEKYDGNYWGGQLSLSDFVDKIEEVEGWVYG